MVKYIVAFVISALLGTIVSLHISLEDNKLELANVKLQLGEVLVREDSYQRDAAKRLAKKTVALQTSEDLLAKSALEIEALRVKLAGAAADAYEWQSSYHGSIASLESLKRDLEKVRCKPVKPVMAVPAKVIKCSDGVCIP